MMNIGRIGPVKMDDSVSCQSDLSDHSVDDISSSSSSEEIEEEIEREVRRSNPFLKRIRAMKVARIQATKPVIAPSPPVNDGTAEKIARLRAEQDLKRAAEQSSQKSGLKKSDANNS